MKSYIGKTVFLENVSQKNTYRNGEYIVIEQSPNNLYGIKPEAGYGGHRCEAFSLIGDDAFVVLRESDDKDFLKRFAKSLRHFAETPKRGETRQWIESVYMSALRNAEIIEGFADCKCLDESHKQVHIVGSTKVTIIVEPV